MPVLAGTGEPHQGNRNSLVYGLNLGRVHSLGWDGLGLDASIIPSSLFFHHLDYEIILFDSRIDRVFLPPNLSCTVDMTRVLFDHMRRASQTH